MSEKHVVRDLSFWERHRCTTTTSACVRCGRDTCHSCVMYRDRDLERPLCVWCYNDDAVVIATCYLCGDPMTEYEHARIVEVRRWDNRVVHTFRCHDRCLENATTASRIKFDAARRERR